MMTIGELITRLRAFDPATKIAMYDSEGCDDFLPIRHLNRAKVGDYQSWKALGDWRGERWEPILVPRLVSDDREPGVVPTNVRDVIILSPWNAEGRDL